MWTIVNWINKVILQSAEKHLSPFVRWLGFPGGSDGKESACNAGDPGSTPESGRSPEEGNGNPLQYSCLENSTAPQHGAWWATGHGIVEPDTTEWLSLPHFLKRKGREFKWHLNVGKTGCHFLAAQSSSFLRTLGGNFSLPSFFSAHMYFQGNPILIFLIHLHLTHHSVFQEYFQWAFKTWLHLLDKWVLLAAYPR